MDMNDKKKAILVVVVIVLAAGIFFFTSSPENDGIQSIDAGEMITLMCRNEKCGHVFDMEKRDYYTKVEEVRRPNDFGWPKIECPECGRKTIDRAVRCQNCDKVFFMYAVLNDFPDRCPYCGFSPSEKK